MTINLGEIIERYKPVFDQHNLHIYCGKPDEDLMILRWWMKLHESGDMERLIIPDSHNLKGFFGVFAQPTALIYQVLKGEITHAGWYKPVEGTAKTRNAYAGLWCSDTIRGTRTQGHALVTTYTLAFEFYDAILGLTWQKDLLEEHEKMGYTVVGCIPNMYDKPYCYQVHLTRDNFFKSRVYLTYKRIIERS